MGEIKNCIIVVTGNVHSLRDEVAGHTAQHFGISHIALPPLLEADLVEAQLNQQNSVDLQSFIDSKLIGEARAAMERKESVVISGPFSPSSAALLACIISDDLQYRGIEVSCIQTDNACCFHRFEKFCRERRIELPENAFNTFTSRVLKAMPLNMRRYRNWEQFPVKKETLDTIELRELFAKIAQNQLVGV